jgi:molybdenum cofactor biosynthesis protein B
MSYQIHINDSQQIHARCAVLTVSDTRATATDKSGQKITELLAAAGHLILHYQIIKDEPAAIGDSIDAILKRDDIDAVLTNGGTGISRRDQTVDVIQMRIEQPLDGFGELFRMLSYEQIGSGAMMSRAVGGIARGKPVFAMPGSPAAVELAMTKLILPELKHLLRELQK